MKTFVFFWICLILSNAMAIAEDWPQYRGLQRNGYSSETGLHLDWGNEGPKELWNSSIGTGFASFTIVDGKVYTMGFQDGKDIVWCLNADTGEEIWHYGYESGIFDQSHEGGPACTPPVNDGRVYTTSRQAILHCLDANKGEVLWKYDLKKDFGADIPVWGYVSSPLVEGDLLIVDAGYAVAFNKKTGDVVWKSEKNYKTGYSAPIAFDHKGQRVVAMFNRFGLAVLSLADGNELYAFPWPTQHGVNSCVPILHGGKAYISASYGQGTAYVDLTGDQAKEIWTSKKLENHFNASILKDGYLYGYNGHYGRGGVPFTCTKLDTGEIVWTEKSVSRGSVLFADGKLIALTGEGEMVVIDPSPEKYQEVARAQILGGKCWTEPALANKKLYARNAQGNLVCIDLNS